MRLCSLADDMSSRRGKVSVSLLSSEMSMKRLVEDLELHDPSGRKRKDKKFPKKKPVCSWEGVSCNLEHEILRIGWAYSGLRGNISWSFFPSTVADINLRSNALRGEIISSALPEGLVELSLANNLFSGPLDLAKLPKTIQHLNVGGNKLSQASGFCELPEQIREIHLEDNSLRGTLDLSTLPASLKFMNLSENAYEGILNLTEVIQAGILRLDIRGNFFTEQCPNGDQDRIKFHPQKEKP